MRSRTAWSCASAALAALLAAGLAWDGWDRGKSAPSCPGWWLLAACAAGAGFNARRWW